MNYIMLAAALMLAAGQAFAADNPKAETAAEAQSTAAAVAPASASKSTAAAQAKPEAKPKETAKTANKDKVSLPAAKTPGRQVIELPVMPAPAKSDMRGKLLKSSGDKMPNEYTPKLTPETKRKEAEAAEKASLLRKRIKELGAKRKAERKSRERKNVKPPSDKELEKILKNMQSDNYETRRAAFYKIYPLRISFLEGWQPFVGDAKAKASLAELLMRELRYQTPPPDKPGRPCRGDSCPQYLMDLLSAVASIRNAKVAPVLLQSYSGLAGFGGFVHMSVTQYGDTVVPKLLEIHAKGSEEAKNRAFYSLLVLLKGGGWNGDVYAGPESAKAINGIAMSELNARTTPDNLRRKGMAVRLLRDYAVDPKLAAKALEVYRKDESVRRECDNAYFSGILDKELIRYVRVSPSGKPEAQPASKDKK
ncbi:MAG: hypothetical protein GX410_09685 [Elusimicrobia bacterium]|nr:hypothetical protein [Elusimicrobiota bacterium]